MKKNLLKIASLFLVLAMIFSFAACKSDKDNGDSTAPSESSADANNTVSDESTPAEASSEDASAESTEIETVTDASGKVIETKPADSGKAPVVTSKGNKAPSSTADILNYYNAATKAAVSPLLSPPIPSKTQRHCPAVRGRSRKRGASVP